MNIGQWTWNGFNVISDLASIAGLVITIWVLFRVGKIQASFSRQALLPIYLKKLGGSIKNLKQHQKSKDIDQIRSVLIISLTTLGDMADHLKDKRAKKVAEVISTIGQIQSQSEQVLWDQCGMVIAELEAVHETIGNLITEMPWRGRDAR